MPPGIGLRTAVGAADEVAYGTYAAPTLWTEVLSESLERRQRTLNSAGLRGGLRAPQRASRRVLTTHDAGGDLNFEVPKVGFAKWLKPLLGAPVTAQQAATTAYKHTFAMGEIGGKSLSIQKIIRDSAGADLQAFSYTGAKVLGAEFSIGIDGVLQARLSVDAREEETSEAAGAPSYANTGVFHFKEASLTLDAVAAVNVTGATVGVQNALKTDRYFLGSAGLKAEPVDNAHPSVSGQITCEFQAIADFYAAFAADTSKALVLLFEGATIEAAHKETFKITVPVVKLEGETPKVSGPDLIGLTVPITGLWDGTNAGITIELITTETSV